MRTLFIFGLVFGGLGPLASAAIPGWPESVREIQFSSDGDQTLQPALFAPASGEAPRPLVIFLHQWGGNYLTKSGAPVARWCLGKNWNFLQPDFRGPNVRPEAMGSDLVIADLRSAVEFAKANAAVDPARIYLVGASGGGHAALLAAGRLPGLFRAVSAWVPITDLPAWSRQCENTSHKGYAKNITAACGGPLIPGSFAEQEAIKRSPLTHLPSASGTVFDLNAGIHDGHGSAVPISHTLNAFNALARPKDRLADEAIRVMTDEKRIPDALRFDGLDNSYGEKSVLFRKQSDQVRVTVFEGGHEIVTPAALAWLESLP